MTAQNEQEDTRITAYALGELRGEDKKRFEAELADSEELRDELEELEETLGLVKDELGRAPARLSAERRQKIRDVIDGDAKVVKLESRRPRRFVWLGAVSAAAVAAGSFFLVSSGMSPTESDLRHAEVPGTEAESQVASKHALLEDTDKQRIARPSPAPPGGRMQQKAKTAGSFLPEPPPVDREQYDHLDDNPFIRVSTDPRSTFSIDVDTASYTLMRRHLRDGKAPPKGAVRIEEMINYFSYDYPEPVGDRPFSVTTEVSAAPWQPEHRLVRIGLKGKHVAPKDVPGTNLVFLLDVSGSMNSPAKLPLLKRAFSMLVDQLGEEDRISIVVYAGASGVVLPPTPGNRKSEILGALDRLSAGGSTNGGEGIRVAYDLAQKSFVKGGINRVLLATDGDFNVGTTSQSELVDLIEEKAKSDVFLTVLGFGRGNYNDSMLEKLADKGNGNYAYIDSIGEARKVLVEQATGTLMTIAKDVKIQIEFNPAQVAAFRLIGYENRVLAHKDFNDDKKDAGEIGADHTVTALYQVVPVGQKVPEVGPDALKYQAPARPTPAAASGETATVKLRYKQPNADTSQLFEHVVKDSGATDGSRDFRFAAAVAELGMLLRSSPYKGKASYEQVLSLASDSANDPKRRELVELAKLAKDLAPSRGR